VPLYISRRGGVGVGFGCLGSLILAVFYLLPYAAIALVVGLIAAGVLAVVIAVLLARRGLCTHVGQLSDL
jgi:hypothetical protein